MPPARGASSRPLPSRSTPGYAGSPPCPPPPTGNAPSGTSSVMWPTCPPPAKWCCSTAPGTTGPGWNGWWAFAATRSTGNSCAPAPSSSGCWSAPASPSSSTGSRSATRSRRSASRSGSAPPSSAGNSAPWICNPARAGSNTPAPRMTCLPTPIPRTAPGSWWTPTTSAVPASTASPTCWARCPTRRSTTST